jgi:hypothetical protein
MYLRRIAALRLEPACLSEKAEKAEKAGSRLFQR